MRSLPLFVVGSLLCACQGEGQLEVVDPDATTTTSTADTGATQTITGGGGACGEITRHQVTVTGNLVLGNGSPAAFADVWVEDRGWNPTTITIGSDTADGGGNFSIQIDELVSAENCWGTVLDYVLVGQQGGVSGERQINNPLYNAITDGTNAADVASLTLE